MDSLTEQRFSCGSVNAWSRCSIIADDPLSSDTGLTSNHADDLGFKIGEGRRSRSSDMETRKCRDSRSNLAPKGVTEDVPPSGPKFSTEHDCIWPAKDDALRLRTAGSIITPAWSDW
ncbi:hypothetical protein NUW54_g12388 [Trametes sanguinea]|uniref:Uncharacterized protein n=1 Tax=Trametes sanguinea TaxID=158606 RepID=A0ACC1MY16_9APHY|nr:hypothetical protein NUW54_g12388 [Trametes sanguinea]